MRRNRNMNARTRLGTSVTTALVTAASTALVSLPGIHVWGAEAKNSAAKIEKLAGSDIARIILVDQASRRLGVQTAPVREIAITALGADGQTLERRKVIAYSAVIYDTAGKAWVYTNPEPLVYIRHAITIDYSEGNTTFLKNGPRQGTEVVVTGAAELYGAETGVK
jgi:hypothetical protein